MFPAGNREDKTGEIGEASHLRVGEHAEEQVIVELQQEHTVSTSSSVLKRSNWILPNVLWSRCPADIQLNYGVCPWVSVFLHMPQQPDCVGCKSHHRGQI